MPPFHTNTDPKMPVNPKHFIFIVDSFGDEVVHPIMQNLGLIEHEDYHLTGAGGADILLGNPEMIKSEKLLVFSSTIHGNMIKGIGYAKRVKELNPAARIIFRSIDGHQNPDPSVFDGFMKKDPGFFLEEVERFLQD